MNKRKIQKVLFIIFLLFFSLTMGLPVQATEKFEIKDNCLVKYNGNDKKVVISKSVTSIGKYAFYDCTKLEEITIPKSVTIIEKGAFYNCTKLKTIKIPKTVTKIGDYAFYNCAKLKTIEIPKSVKTIGKGAFMDCSSLTSVALSESIETINDYAFCSCTKLEEITIPKSVKKIGKYAFYNCSNLPSIILSNSVKNIGDYAFAYCYGLTSMTIPKSVKTIGNYAFYWCYRLASVTVLNSPKTIGDDAFSECSKELMFCVKENSVIHKYIKQNKYNYYCYSGNIAILIKEGGNATVGKKSTINLTTVVLTTNVNSQKIKWSSSDKKIAVVDKNGAVTGVSEGKVTIIATLKSDKTIKGKLPITVTMVEERKEEREQLAKKMAKSIIESEGINYLESDVAKVKAVHDYLILNTAYDYENYKNDTIPKVSFEEYGIIVLKIGVCEGYRKAFQLFMDILEIPCEGIIGTANEGLHAWNIVTLDGERYHIDLTWNDPVPDKIGQISYNYFLLDDETMKKDHIWDTNSVKPCTGKKYRIYPYEVAGQLANTEEEIKSVVNQQYAKATSEQFEIKVLSKLEYNIAEYLWRELGVEGTLWYYPTVQIGEYYYYHVLKK